MTYKEFADQRDKLSKSDYSIFIERQQVTGLYTGFGDNGLEGKSKLGNYNPEINPVKHIMHHILQPTTKVYTQWSSFEGRKARRMEYEQHICVYQGTEKFRLVSPIYRKNLYVNVFDD